MNEEWRQKRLLDIISSDTDDIFAVPPEIPRVVSISSDSRLVESFEEINSFFESNGREPEEENSQMSEYLLAARLKEMREDEDKAKALRPYDKFKLLGEEKKIESIDDIFNDPELADVFDIDEEDDIFTLRHVSKPIDKADFVAQRKLCENFYDYEQLFSNCHLDLKAGKRQLVPFAKEQEIYAGQFFILHGVMVYVDRVGKTKIKNGKRNARLYCVFENGTESNMLLRSLAVELYKDPDGKRVSENEDHLLDELHGVAEEDEPSGYIYVLTSLHPKLADTEDLYKIGFSRTPVEQRIKNAANEPTYLMAPVKIETSFMCYNLNPQKLEKILHKLFGHVRLQFDVFDKNGKRFNPREWFIVPLPIITKVIHLIISGDIINYRYNQSLMALEKI